MSTLVFQLVPSYLPGTHSLLIPDPAGSASQARFCLGSARRSLGWETVCPSPWMGTHGPQHFLQGLVWVFQAGLEGLGRSHSTSNSAFLEENSTTYPNCEQVLMSPPAHHIYE